MSPLPQLDAAAQPLQRQGAGLRNGSSIDKGQAIRDWSEGRCFGYSIVRKAAPRAFGQIAEDGIADTKGRDAIPYGLDVAGNVGAENTVRRTKGGRDTGKGSADQQIPVPRVDRGGANPHQHFTGAGL